MFQKLGFLLVKKGMRKICCIHSRGSRGGCCCSVAKSCQTLCHPMGFHQASLSFTISWSLLKLMSIKLVMPSNHLILCRPLLLLPSVFPSIRIFFNQSSLQLTTDNYSGSSTTVITSWGFTANSLLFVCGSCVFPFVYAFNASFSFFQTIGPKCSHVLEPVAYCHCKCIQEQNHESSNFMYEERVVWETLHSKEDQSWVFFGSLQTAAHQASHHHLLELAQRHVHWVGDAIQSSHPLSSPSPPALNLSQNQGLF